MKVLFFIESLQSGGKERRLVELIKGFNRLYPDLECDIVLMDKQIHYREIYDLKVKIHFLERGRIKKDPSIFYKFYKICKKAKPDLINVWGNMVAFYSIFAKVALRIPLINGQITDVPFNFPNSIFSHKVTFIFSDLILANSKAGVDAYKPPINKTKIIYNGFDFGRLNHLKDQAEVKKELEIKTKNVVGMVASFSDLKDYDTFIKSAILVLSDYSAVTFLCIGSGNKEKHKNMIPIELKNNFRFLEARNDVESIMNICDIGVLTSFGEGTSNALIEFMALGKPVLSTNLGGTPELIKNNINGFLLEPFNYSQLAKLISTLLIDEAMCKGISDNNITEVRSRFSMDRMINEYYHVYNTVLK
jgi:glycosyltransferase involved in cell wall biosynthesis